MCDPCVYVCAVRMHKPPLVLMFANRIKGNRMGCVMGVRNTCITNATDIVLYILPYYVAAYNPAMVNKCLSALLSAPMRITKHEQVEFLHLSHMLAPHAHADCLCYTPMHACIH